MQGEKSEANRVGLKWYNIVAGPLVLMLGLGVAVAAHRARPKPAPQQTEDLPPMVAVEPVRLFDEMMELEVDGTVVPYREVAISSQIAGRIKRRTEKCEAGRAVEAGDLLIEIDPQDFQLTVERLETEVRQAEANMAENGVEIENNLGLIKLADQDLQLQARDVVRLKNLVREKAVSDTDLDNSLRREVAARNVLETLKNRTRILEAKNGSLKESLQLAQTRLQQAKVDLDRTRIVSPIEGVVVMEHVEEDSYVQPGADLATIEDTSKAEVRVMLRLDQIHWLWGYSTDTDDRTMRSYELPRVAATIEYELQGRVYSWNGTLSRYDGIGLDPRTRTVPCRVVVDDPREVRIVDATSESSASRPPALLRGMFVRVRLHVPAPSNLLQITRLALQPGNRVLRVSDNRISVIPVNVARILDDRVVLRGSDSPLHAEDQVVVSPLASVEEGMEVRVAPAANQSSSQVTFVDDETTNVSAEAESTTQAIE
jgi:multidrug efflux pump subunit AcrA (membrane-fusion protein)